jgi:hypothetical protein
MTEIVSTHDKIRENWLKMTGQINDAKNAKEIAAKQVSQLDRIEMVLQSLVDKVAAIDLYLRGQPLRRKSHHDINNERVIKEIKQDEGRLIDSDIHL